MPRDSAECACEWSFSNLPPEGHDDVGPWFWENCFLQSAEERERLELREIWRANHKLYRGNHWGYKKKRDTLTVNLFFANINRTVANITNQEPAAEVVDMDGSTEHIDRIITNRVQTWWKTSKQQLSIVKSVTQQEIYGITWEKAMWHRTRREPAILICDPFSVLPAPGVYTDIAAEAPYICHMVEAPVAKVEKQYKTDGVQSRDNYDLLGRERDEDFNSFENISALHGDNGIPTGHYKVASHNKGLETDKALIVEIWVRDYRVGDDGEMVYPGGIRVVTLTNEGEKVLVDSKNPNLNWALPKEDLEKTYLYRRFPFAKSNSYDDPNSIWGFSASEQVGDLNIKIDEIVSKMVKWVMRSMTGILVIPKDSGITKSDINGDPGLVLWPENSAKGAGIKLLPYPNLPSTFFTALDLLINFFDRVYAIQDADRGQTSGGVIAASAIVALQERNQVLIQHKINAVDHLVEQRGQHSVSLWQNFGIDQESVEVFEKKETFIGTNYAGRKFNFIVESGSMMPKTSVHVQEQSVGLYKENAIDRRALLERINYPGWRQIDERMTEKEGLAPAIDILRRAGLPDEHANFLFQWLNQTQFGPEVSVQPETGPTGATGEGGVTSTPQPGTPRAFQGSMNEVTNA